MIGRNLMMCLGCMAVAVNGLGEVDAEEAVGLRISMKRLAPQIADIIQRHQAGRRCDVAVFPFGDEAGKAGKSLGVTPQVVQGELILGLKAQSEKVSVLGPVGLKTVCLDAGVSVAAVGPANPSAVAEFLTQVKLDVAVVGSVTPHGDSHAKTAIHAHVVFANGVTESCQTICTEDLQGQLGVSPDHVESVPPALGASVGSQFEVEILIDGQKRELLQCADPSSAFWKVRFLKLQPDDLGEGPESLGKRFSVRMTNLAVSERDEQSFPTGRGRLFAAALLLDGVNSIYHLEDDRRVPVIRHPRHVRRWILTSPGWFVHEAPTGQGAFRLSKTKRRGHSSLTVKGFQRTKHLAEAFRFGDSQDSVAAATLGITNDIGMISVHFFPEKTAAPQLAQAPGVARRTAGVVAGETITQKTIHISAKFEENPVEVWRIFYFEDASDLPPDVDPGSLHPIAD